MRINFTLDTDEQDSTYIKEYYEDSYNETIEEINDKFNKNGIV